MLLYSQFDILWDELSGQEHLQLFASIKGLPQASIQSVCNTQKLKGSFTCFATQKTFKSKHNRIISIVCSHFLAKQDIFSLCIR